MLSGGFKKQTKHTSLSLREVQIRDWTPLLPRHENHSISFVSFNGLKIVLHTQMWIVQDGRGEKEGNEILVKADGNDGRVMQEAYRWHDEIEVCFYTNLNCSVWRRTTEKKSTSFTHNSPRCLLKALLCKEVVCDSNVREEILFSTALPWCYFRIVIST